MCADCQSPDPLWASTNIGVLICIKCSGCHRNLGSHISKLQSIVLDTKWTEKSLEMIIEKGNLTVNEEYEHNLDILKPNSNSST
jgi:hypothetical protein